MKGLLYFIGGGIIGSAVTYFLMKSSFEEKLQQQALDIYEHYKNESKSDEDTSDEADPVDIPNSSTVKGFTVASNNVAYNTPMTNYASKTVSKNFGPYVISSKDAGEGYELQNTLFHHADNVLVDANGHILSPDEIEKFVGLDYADHFGEVDDDNDILYIRNEELGTDWEIEYSDEPYYKS